MTGASGATLEKFAPVAATNTNVWGQTFPGRRPMLLSLLFGQSPGMVPTDGKELTLRGVALGVALTLLFTAANVYLGLKLRHHLLATSAALPR